MTNAQELINRLDDTQIQKFNLMRIPIAMQADWYAVRKLQLGHPLLPADERQVREAKLRNVLNSAFERLQPKFEELFGSEEVVVREYIRDDIYQACINPAS